LSFDGLEAKDLFCDLLLLCFGNGFWAWWTEKWFSRDAAFLRMRLEHLKHLRSRHIQKAYKDWHDLDYLRKDTPLESSYYRREFNEAATTR